MKKILIIEDETLIALSLKKLLSKRGHEVLTVESGHEAIGLLKTVHFDRVICDLMLQDISGFDISQVLERAREYGCKILSKPFEDLNKALSVIEGE